MNRNDVLKWGLSAIVMLVALYFVHGMYVAGDPVLAVACLGASVLAVYVYTSRRALTYRYLFPGLAGIAIFVVLPLVYTIGLGFTRYRSENFLTFERATIALLGETYERGEDRYRVTLYGDDQRARLLLEPVKTADEPAEEDSIFGDEEEDSIFGEEEEDSIFGDEEGSEEAGEGEGDSIFGEEEEDSIFGDEEGGEQAEEGEGDGIVGDDEGSAAGEGEGAAGPPAQSFVTGPIPLDATGTVEVAAVPREQAADMDGATPLPRAALIARRDALEAIKVRFPDGSWAVKDKLSLDLFLPQVQLYRQSPDGTLTDQKIGQVLTPNFDTGFYETPGGEIVRPGFRVFVGLDNYARIFTDERMQEPFLRIFVWTVVFAGLTVLFTLVVGLVLAELMSWESLRFRGVYQVLLFLPYGVPAFISILVFKGLFNTASGEINQILEMLLGLRPDWFGDPFLARAMILLVNTWLGYPYFMLLCMGLKKSVPGDLYEATALAGAGPLTNFFKITWPLIRKPLAPLLIASFAFNFNNFMLIFLLTGGRPDFLDTSTPAGETDILVSYTYRIAFQDSGQDYGLAGTISTLIFLLVAILSLINLRLGRVNQADKR